MQVEKGGMDEAFVDVTEEAKLRVVQGACPAAWHGHLHLGEVRGCGRHLAFRRLLDCELGHTYRKS